MVKQLLISLLIGSLLIQILLISSAQTTLPPNFADCMKNPFASGCRGISAKRSQLPPTQLTETIGMLNRESARRPRRLSLAELLARTWVPEVDTLNLLAAEPNIMEVYRTGE